MRMIDADELWELLKAPIQESMSVWMKHFKRFL